MAKQALRNIHRLIGEAKKETPHEQSFLADLNTSIEKMNAASGRVPSRSYKPSSMQCVRNMYFQVVGATQDDERATAELVGMMQSGSSRHEELQRVISSMKDFGVDCIYVDVATYIAENKLDYLTVVSKQGFETKLYHKGLNISFLCDGLLLYRGVYYILEIKTESMYKWQTRTGVAEAHIPQGATYALCFGINKVLFVYECRDNTSKKSYILEITDEMKYDVMGKIETSDAYVAKMVPPPKPLDLPKNVCAYCSYKAECRKAGK